MVRKPPPSSPTDKSENYDQLRRGLSFLDLLQQCLIKTTLKRPSPAFKTWYVGYSQLELHCSRVLRSDGEAGATREISYTAEQEKTLLSFQKFGNSFWDLQQQKLIPSL